MFPKPVPGIGPASSSSDGTITKLWKKDGLRAREAGGGHPQRESSAPDVGRGHTCFPRPNRDLAP